MADVWPRWSDNAKRGDIMRLAISQRSINVQLYQSISALVRGDKKEAMEKLEAAMAADKKLDELIDLLGNEK